VQQPQYRLTDVCTVSNSVTCGQCFGMRRRGVLTMVLTMVLFRRFSNPHHSEFARSHGTAIVYTGHCSWPSSSLLILPTSAPNSRPFQGSPSMVPYKSIDGSNLPHREATELWHSVQMGLVRSPPFAPSSFWI
jgi:hypothetical protein